jgi:hypothetical protein
VTARDQHALEELPLGCIRPTGWLHDQVRLQADGLTGRLEEIWPDVGAASGWLGGGGEDGERGPYYVDGLLPLAHVLGDADLLAKALVWVEAMLAGQRQDGQFGPTGNDDWWPRMVALKVLTQHADATGDERVPPFLSRYFRFQVAQLPARPLEGWGRARGADNVLSILWLHRRTGEAWLVDLCRLVLSQTDDWATFLTQQLPEGPVKTFRHLTHGPNVAMGLKTPAVQFRADGDERHREETASMLANLLRRHGQVHGVFSGDEWLGGREPHHGVETCQVVELMFTLEQIMVAFGDAGYADLLEQVAFNLLPAACDPRLLAHQYHQQANQVLVSFAPRDWSFSGPDANVFGLEPHFGCCTANLHQGWPKLVRSLWMRSDRDTLTAVVYAPCTVLTALGDTSVRLDVDTSYPFTEEIEIAVTVEAPTDFALRLRVPAWCQDASLIVAGADVEVVVDHSGYVRLERTWADGDTVRLTLPMQPRTVRRDRGAVGVRLGPLVMVHAVEEVWRPVPDAEGLAEWEITPRSWWNLGLCLDDPDAPPAWPVRRRPVAPVPFTAAGAPVVIRATGVPLPDWRLVDSSAGPLPDSPKPTQGPIVDMPLLPYGCARLRVAEMPTLSMAKFDAG